MAGGSPTQLRGPKIDAILAHGFNSNAVSILIGAPQMKAKPHR
jgi:hypothetical protein